MTAMTMTTAAKTGILTTKLGFEISVWTHRVFAYQRGLFKVGPSRYLAQHFYWFRKSHHSDLQHAYEAQQNEGQPAIYPQ